MEELKFKHVLEIHLSQWDLHIHINFFLNMESLWHIVEHFLDQEHKYVSAFWLRRNN